MTKSEAKCRIFNFNKNELSEETLQELGYTLSVYGKPNSMNKNFIVVDKVRRAYWFSNRGSQVGSSTWFSKVEDLK